MDKSNSSKSTIKETYNNDIIINELKNLVMTQNRVGPEVGYFDRGLQIRVINYIPL